MGIEKRKSAGKKMNRTWRLIEQDRMKKVKEFTDADQKRLDDNIRAILKFRK